MSITITREANEQLRGVLEQNAGAESGLRLWVQSACGCGNVSYGMGIDEAGAGDSVYDTAGIKVILDAASASLLSGATIDFVDQGVYGRGFVIHTADESGGGCGCGAH
ncbi:MAG: HesB/IscA family protein [Thermomicrobiales bacterium]